MPIRPSERGRYPANWRSISLAIRARSGGQCECDGLCGLHAGRRCEERNGEAARWARGKVVLTVAHLDHTPENVDECNLSAMCQRCHLRYDIDHHRRTREATRRERDPQGRLFPSGKE
jgi:hypothetical protein